MVHGPAGAVAPRSLGGASGFDGLALCEAMPAAFPGMNDLRFLVECNHWVMSGQLLAKQTIHLQVDHHIFINQLALF